MQLDEPIETFQLVSMHFTVWGQTAGLLVHTDHSSLGLCRFEQLFVLFGLGHATGLAARSLFALFGVSSSHRTYNIKTRKASSGCQLPKHIIKNYVEIPLDFTYPPKNAQRLPIAPRDNSTVPRHQLLLTAVGPPFSFRLP
jgi:hypothetical protein